MEYAFLRFRDLETGTLFTFAGCRYRKTDWQFATDCSGRARNFNYEHVRPVHRHNQADA
jgi:hypothetical protein